MSGSNPWGKRILIAVIIVLIILIAYFIGRRYIFGSDHFTIEQTSEIVSSLDDLPYRVHKGHEGFQKAADTMAALNKRVIDLMRYLRNKYVREVPYANDGNLPPYMAYPQRRKAVERMLKRYNPDNLAENSPDDPSKDTSYSLDKGAIVAICLRERDAATHDIHDLDTLTFVTLHEMTHIAIDAVDHPAEFWRTFKFLLNEAQESGIYTSPPYAQRPKRYCGVVIDYNPVFDASLPTIY
jgi:hypothetical protein